MSSENSVIKNIMIVIAFVVGIFLLGLVSFYVNRMMSGEAKRKQTEEKEAIRKEFNQYGLLGNEVLSKKVLYEPGNYVIYSDRILKKLSISEESAQGALSRAQALSEMFPEKPVVVLPVPKRIMTEERSFGSRDIYDGFIKNLRSHNDNKNIRIADPSKKLEQSSEFTYFRTKDGWTMNGAYYGYREVMSLLGGESLGLEQFIYFQSNDFSGGLKNDCRAAKDFTPEMEEVVDVIPRDPFVYRVSRGFKDYETYYDKKAEKELKGPVISLLSQGIVGDGIDYAVLEGNGSGILLIVGDGESKMMAPYFTEHYEKVILIDVGECKTDDFTSMISDIKVDAVVIAQAVDKIGLSAYSKTLNGLVKKDGSSD
ncbi:MAG: hypothetical protein K5886_01740 [Lachnospiraceae bacterium]|nr:hypothetical protein [Lachnospiraceae bacterium]